MTLAFECIFKLIFGKRKFYVNDFQKYYRQMIDERTGEVYNKKIDIVDQKNFNPLLKKKRKPIDDYTHSDPNVIRNEGD